MTNNNNKGKKEREKRRERRRFRRFISYYFFPFVRRSGFLELFARSSHIFLTISCNCFFSISISLASRATLILAALLFLLSKRSGGRERPKPRRDQLQSNLGRDQHGVSFYQHLIFVLPTHARVEQTNKRKGFIRTLWDLHRQSN